MDDEQRPEMKETIHNHPVYCDDLEVRRYLKKLDDEEAKAIFEYARMHGTSEFEMRKPGSNERQNCSMQYDDGAYIVTIEGNEGGSGWF